MRRASADGRTGGRVTIRYAGAVAAHHGVVHRICDNAGIPGGGPVEVADREVCGRTLAVDLFGVARGARASWPT
ncbi:hypothetical protein ACIPYS_09830 [Kitasatospora sp. NPDC089913]|uniref:hypothetical protein n=1 Tax=Kitasatospora sp. NPDC089913 TaxID=3364080 RepID=UPI00381DB0AB